MMRRRLLFILITVCYPCKYESRNSINMMNPLKSKGETLVSPGNIFELGFFTREQGKGKNSTYLGIWYYQSKPSITVWVANRDEPMSNFCGLPGFGIAEDGNIKLWCDSEDLINVTTDLDPMKSSNGTIQLLDSGNLVLVDGQSSPLWQSFDHPTDTFLPGMKSNGVKLTSWRSPVDPGTGNYTFKQDQGFFILRNRSAVYWRSGARGPSLADKLPQSVRQLLLNSTAADKKDKLPQSVRQLLLNSTAADKKSPARSYNNFTGSSSSSVSRLVMNYSGQLQGFFKSGSSWSVPENNCTVCGNSAFCNTDNVQTWCDCPRGFTRELDGCVREDSNSCNDEDIFSTLLLMESPGEAEQFEQAISEKDCKEECLRTCQCKAYSYRNSLDRGSRESVSECWLWKNELETLHRDNIGGILNISLRGPPTSLASVKPRGEDPVAPKSKSRKKYEIFVSLAVAGVAVVAFLSCILYQRRRKATRSGQQENARDTPALISNESERRGNKLMHGNDMNIDLPFYNVEDILSATDNFSDANKLGQGGFGPVYKGKFPGGQEFAVKRLSSCSGQGAEEFLNEVVLIAKLQHRNLVRLLGYCIKENEKILLYEYMPNKSLDGFIFDQSKSLVLDWKKRFNIILGIVRGLLYLHQDSRLRIIHRDLKTSNILLDEDMNPKISDFGLARIVEGKGTEASTNKVVGTYGYMSPEYALDGKFSTKSDVFSFGVVILEIISGKRTTGFYNPNEVLNLLGYTWRLWSEDRALDLVDPALAESCEKCEVMKCINIGLLCVKEDPNERPSMSDVVIMLGSDVGPLPTPTKPAFVLRQRLSVTSSSSSMITKNELTLSIAQGR